MQGRILPLIHRELPCLLNNVRVHSSSDSSGLSIGVMPSIIACTDSVNGKSIMNIQIKFNLTGTQSENISLVMLCSFEKYCWAVVLHSRLLVKKSFKTENVNNVSICLNVAGKRPVLTSCTSLGCVSEHSQNKISMSKIPLQSTTVISGFPDVPVRDLWTSMFLGSWNILKWSNSVSEMAGAGEWSSGCGVPLGVGS
jgi:hypothetical protein